MLISYYANKKSSPGLPSWQRSLISFNTPIDPGSIIKLCTPKHFQVPFLAPGLQGGIRWDFHDSDVIMGAMASQITSVSIVYSTACSDADQRKHQSSASLDIVRGIHRWPVSSPHKGPVTRKMFPFDDVIMQCKINTSPSNLCPQP